MTDTIVLDRPSAFVVTLETPDARAWDAFVGGSADASYTHLSAWRTVLNDGLGHETVQLVARERDGSWVGVLPLAWVRSTMVGKYLISMPFLNSGGPIGSREARTALAQAAANLARSGGADLLELRSRQPCEALTTSNRKLTVCLPLAETSELMWKRFPSKLRSQIKRPQAAGYVTRFGPQERDAFYGVYSRHMRDLGSPALGKRVFDLLPREFGDLVDFGVVYDQGGRALAAGCGFAWRDEFELVWASSLRDANASAPNMLLYWAFMERSIARGLRTFDFGRCSPGSGTHRFKRQWGGEDVALPWAQWSATGVSEPVSASRPHYAVAAAIWKRLPPVVTRTCGPSLARLIP